MSDNQLMPTGTRGGIRMRKTSISARTRPAMTGAQRKFRLEPHADDESARRTIDEISWCHSVQSGVNRARSCIANIDPRSAHSNVVQIRGGRSVSIVTLR